MNFWPNEQPSQADDLVELAQTRPRGPTNPLVPRAERESRRAKAEGAQPTVIAPDEIAQLGPHQRRIAAGVLLDDQIIPQSMQGILGASNQMQMQPLHLIHTLGHLENWRQRLAGGLQPMRPRIAPLARRQ